MNNFHRQTGSVMVEFAGALILLLLLVFGISEIGRAIYQLNTLAKSVESGARYMSRTVGILNFNPDEDAEGQCAVNDTAWHAAVTRATNIVLYGTEIAGSVTRLPNMSVTSITATPHIDTQLAKGGACVIKVNAQARFSSIFGEYIIPAFFSADGDTNPYKGVVFTTSAEHRYLGE